MYEKIWNAVSASVQKNKELLTLFLKEKVGPASLQVLKQDEVMRLIVSRIHGTLPLPVRLFMREDKFVNLFINNKERALRILSPLMDGLNEKTRALQPAVQDEKEHVGRVGADDNADGMLTHSEQEIKT